MNILFFSMVNVTSLDERNIYTDLLRELIKLGHHVVMISPIEERYDTPDNIVVGNGYQIIKPHVGNITNTPLIKKGKSIMRIPRILIKCIDQNVKSDIDLFITATPPVTIDTVISHVKKKYHAKVYLLLKDIWPGNIFKMKLPGGLITQTAIFSVLRPHEMRLYNKSDFIGCMSPACQKYILDQNPSLDKTKTHINPNSIEVMPSAELSLAERNHFREKYNIPKDKVCFIYGGTLGIGQGIPHLVNCLDACRDLNCFFLIIGRGIHKKLLDEYYEKRLNEDSDRINFAVYEWIPKEDYDCVLKACDVGMIFVRKESIVPTFPSRILSYMEFSKPVIACVSRADDIVDVIENGNFGWGCYSDYVDDFKNMIINVLSSDITKYGNNSRAYLENNYTASISAKIIIDSLDIKSSVDL